MLIKTNLLRKIKNLSFFSKHFIYLQHYIIKAKFEFYLKA